MIKLIVTGCCGKMGRRIISLASQSSDFRIVGATERRSHPDIGKDVGEACGVGNLDIEITDSLEDIVDACDVVVDFTSALSTINNIKHAKLAHKAIVIGTTGLTDEEMAIIKSASASIPILFSPNMSIGVNALFNVVGSVVQKLGGNYDIEIVEAHHNQKKDSPSGTAKRLADEISQAKGKGKKERVPIHSVRAGDIVGDHTVIFAGENERIEITHRAHSRDVFARGALRACKFIAGKSPKLYSMQDFLEEI